MIVNRVAVKYLVVFFVAFFFIIFALWYDKEIKTQEFMDAKTEDAVLHYDSIYDEYRKISNVIFTTKLNTEDVISIFKNAHKSNNTQQQDELRKKLYTQLSSTYELLKSYNIKQMQFHLPDNRSFLRFHSPNLYGDDLTDIRKTVKYANENKKPIDSFETGVVNSGYRFVYPLFDENKNHIGSVELSFSTLALNEVFFKNFHEISNFIVSDKALVRNNGELLSDNYINSPISGFYFEKESVEYLKKNHNHTQKPYIAQEKSKQISKRIFEGKPFTIYNASSRSLITFLPVKNSITNSIDGVFVVNEKTQYLAQQNQNFYILSLVITLLSIGIIVFLYKDKVYKDELQRNNTKLSTIINEADSGIGIIGLNGDFLEVNNTYTTLLGYSKEEMLKLNCIGLTADINQVSSKNAIERALASGNISKFHKICKRKDGTEINLELSLNMLPSKDAFIAVVNSLEEKVQLGILNQTLENKITKAVEDIRHKDKMLMQQSKTAAMGEMIDAIAHQWKNPLAIMRLYAQQIEYNINSEQINKEEINEFAMKTQLQINHLLNTIDEFRTFFRPAINKEVITIKSIIDSVLLLMKDELIKNNIFTSITGELDTTIKVIPNEFKHVLINFITNSRDAFIENKISNRLIRFEIITDENTTVLRIIDNAGGIPQNIIPSIFEANFTTKEEGKGTGIGLYLTKQILDKLNANIEVYNIDDGVCFHIKFV